MSESEIRELFARAAGAQERYQRQLAATRLMLEMLALKRLVDASRVSLVREAGLDDVL